MQYSIEGSEGQSVAPAYGIGENEQPTDKQLREEARRLKASVHALDARLAGVSGTGSSVLKDNDYAEICEKVCELNREFGAFSERFRSTEYTEHSHEAWREFWKLNDEFYRLRDKASHLGMRIPDCPVAQDTAQMEEPMWREPNPASASVTSA